ncbi:hypothetical protein ACOXXX_17620 [Thalassococcus sp. BH17M4-6]
MKTRFLRSVVKTSQNTDVIMPWARGARRAAFVAKRKAPQPVRRSA